MNDASASIIIARAIAVIYLAVAAGAFLRKNYLHDILSSLTDSAALLYLSGMLATLSGVLMLHAQNSWTADWTTVITIAGWAALIKGVVIIACPNVFRLSLLIFGRPVITRFASWLCLALGLFFAYCGFLA